MKSLFLAGALAFVSACATAKTAEVKDEVTTAAKTAVAKKPLFDRLGGKPAIEAVVDDFLGRVSQDASINSGFAVSAVPRIRQRLIELVCAGSGGPCTYSGRDMSSAHRGLGVTSAQFDTLVGHLVATLDKFKVPEAEKGELLSVLGPMKPSIVEEP